MALEESVGTGGKLSDWKADWIGFWGFRAMCMFSPELVELPSGDSGKMFYFLPGPGQQIQAGKHLKPFPKVDIRNVCMNMGSRLCCRAW